MTEDEDHHNKLSVSPCYEKIAQHRRGREPCGPAALHPGFQSCMLLSPADAGQGKSGLSLEEEEDLRIRIYYNKFIISRWRRMRNTKIDCIYLYISLDK